MLSFPSVCLFSTTKTTYITQLVSQQLILKRTISELSNLTKAFKCLRYILTFQVHFLQVDYCI